MRGDASRGAHGMDSLARVPIELKLDLAPDEARRLYEGIANIIEDTQARLEDLPAHPRVAAEEIWRRFNQPLPLKGLEVAALLQEIRRNIIALAANTAGPLFNTYVMTCGSEAGVAGDFLCSFLNQNSAKWHLGPGAAAVELTTLKWLVEFLRLPPQFSGLFVSGGSVANLMGLILARNAAVHLDVGQEGLYGCSPLSVYVSAEVHDCVYRALRVLGTGTKYCRRVPADDEFRMNVSALRRMIEEDLDSEKRPFCVVGSAGTVNTGAIDPLAELADVCAEFHLWFHVDGAYGCPGAASPIISDRFRGLERADSIAIDPHKWLYVPYDMGCLLVRDERRLVDAFRMSPAYLASDHTSSEPDQARIDLHNRGIELSRRFRALKLWMTFKLYGAEGLTRAIENDVSKALYLRDRILDSDDFELLAPVSLSTVCFRYVPSGHNGRTEDFVGKLNQALIVEAEKDGRIAVTGTVLNGTTALRLCFVNHRTQKRHVDFEIEVLRELGGALARRLMS